MSRFKSMKANQDLDKIREQVEKSKGGGERQPNFEIGVDPANEGYARVRLMPAEDGVNNIVSYINLAMTVGTKHYKNKSRRSIGLDDPMQQYRSALWNVHGSEGSKRVSKKEVRVCYVYIYEDKVKPENNGKVMKWYVPFSIAQLIEHATNPPESKFEETTADPFNPFDIYGEGPAGGRDLVIRVNDKNGNRTYERSSFATKPSRWLPDEDEMARLWEEGVKENLADLRKEEAYKSWDDLLKELVEVVGAHDPIIQDLFGDKIRELGLNDKKGSDRKADAGQKTETKREAAKQEDDSVIEKPEPAAEPKKQEAPKSSRQDADADAGDDDDFDFSGFSS